MEFYKIIDCTELITSAFYYGIFNASSKGYNVILIFDMIFEVLEALVANEYNMQKVLDSLFKVKGGDPTDPLITIDKLVKCNKNPYMLP